MRRLNKKGAELTIGTLVIIVLAVIVLVVVALGFGMGWGNLWDKIKGYFGGGVNVDSIKQSCTYACTTKASYDFCSLKRTVTLQDKTKIEKTCKELADSYSGLGFEQCSDIPSCAAATCKGTAKACSDITLLATATDAEKTTVCTAQLGCGLSTDKKSCVEATAYNACPAKPATSTAQTWKTVCEADVKCKYVAAQTTPAVMEACVSKNLATSCESITAGETACKVQQGCSWI